MATLNTQQVLWANITTLMLAKYGREHLTQLAADSGFGPGTSTRLKEQKTSIGLDVLEKLANAFRVEPWQLLVPGIKSDALPSISGPSQWPLELVSRADYDRLTPIEQGAAQLRMADEIKARIAHVKDPPIEKITPETGALRAA